MTGVDAKGVDFERRGGIERIEATTKVWAAGVQASPLGAMLADAGRPRADGPGRSRGARLHAAGHPEVFVVGDLMALAACPGVAEVAIQSGRHAAATIGGGSTATPGRGRSAIATWAPRRDRLATTPSASAAASGVSGFIGWLIWLVVHLRS